MRLLLLSAGAASMYCGSCLRDNALAAALMKRGNDVTLLPFYTPTLTDEENVSRQQRVFFGGISVYLEQHVSLFRHTPAMLDRLWDAPRVIKAFASGSIAVDPAVLGAMTVSTLQGEDGRQRKEIEKLLDWLADEPRPDLINIPYTLLISLAPGRASPIAPCDGPLAHSAGMRPPRSPDSRLAAPHRLWEAPVTLRRT